MFGERQQRFIRRPLARGVGAGGDGEHARAAVRQQRGQVGLVQAAFGVGRQYDQLRATHARGVLPRHQIGVVFQPADDDAIARAQPGLGRPGSPQPLRDGVQRLGRAAGEDELVLAGCADEGFKRGARGIVGVGGALAQAVHAAVNVGALAFFEMAHGLQHLARHLGGGRVVQIGQLVAVDGLREDGEVGAQRLHRQRRGVQQRMWFTHARPSWVRPAGAWRWRAPASPTPASAPACRCRRPRRSGRAPAGRGPCRR